METDIKPEVKPGGRITRRNRLFINEYIKCKNGSEAIRRVYPNIQAPNRYATVLLSKPVIKAEIERYFSNLSLGNDEIVRSIGEIATNGKIESNKLQALKLLAQIKGLLNERPVNNIGLFTGLNQAGAIDVTPDTTTGCVQEPGNTTTGGGSPL